MSAAASASSASTSTIAFSAGLTSAMRPSVDCTASRLEISADAIARERSVADHRHNSDFSDFISSFLPARFDTIAREARAERRAQMHARRKPLQRREVAEGGAFNARTALAGEPGFEPRQTESELILLYKLTVCRAYVALRDDPEIC